MVFLLLIFSPNHQFLYFSPAASFPLKGSWNVTLIYNDQQKCAIYLKKINLPLFLFFFFLSPFSFPLFPSFSFCSPLPHFSPFSTAPFPPPGHSILHNIYPCLPLYETNILLDMVFGFLFFRGKGCALPMCKKFKYKIVLGARARELELES